MLRPLFWRHGGQPLGPLGGIPFAIEQFAIEFSQTRRRRAVRKLNDVPLSAARRLPAVPIAAPIFHRGIATRLAIAFAGPPFRLPPAVSTVAGMAERKKRLARV
jgi:hypothetical protein